MVLELLFLALLIFVLCVFAYRGAVHEFQILQKEYGPEIDWSEVLGEGLPLVVRSLPKSWMGGWTHQATKQKSWVVYVRAPDRPNKRLRTTWSEYIQETNTARPVIDNPQEIARVARLPHAFENWTESGFRRWSWLPVGTPTPYVFSDHDIQGVRKTRAEFTAIVATDGAPLEIWLAHEGAIPENVVDDLLYRDPWTQTTDTIPWINEVRYVEIKLRPGNALLVPKHWYYALRSSGAMDADAWFWVGAVQTPMSWLASRMDRTPATA
jgi:hypothetical protein